MLSRERPGGASKRPPEHRQKPAPKCPRCQGTQVDVMGRMEQSKDTLYRCAQCGFIFTGN